MATVPVPRTWNAGEVWTSTIFNGHVRDPLNFLLDPPCFHGYLAADQTVASALTYTNVTALTEYKDNDGMHTGTSATVTIVTPGRYQITAYAAFAANAAGSRGVRAWVNGATEVGRAIQSASTGGIWSMTSSGEMDLVASDTVVLQVLQNSGGNLACNGVASAPAQTGLIVRWMSV